MAIKIAVEAGEIPLRYHGQDLKIERKVGNEPVTSADRECSDFLVDAMRDAFPDDVIISEEAADNLLRLESERVWYLDPIDGTKSYIEGGTGYCVMLGLAIRHRPVLGLIYQPNHETLIYACRNGGAWSKRPGSDAARLRCSSRATPTDTRVLANRGGDRVAIANAFGIETHEPLGSIGLKLSAIALGACELYTNPVTNCSSWDTCGPEVILEEAGGRLTDLHGHRVRYDSPDTMSLKNGLVASNGHLHEYFLGRLAILFPKTDASSD